MRLNNVERTFPSPLTHFIASLRLQHDSHLKVCSLFLFFDHNYSNESNNDPIHHDNNKKLYIYFSILKQLSLWDFFSSQRLLCRD